MSAAPWPEALPVTRDLDAEARGWLQHAHELASFVDAQMVNRRDVWGGYYAIERRETGKPFTFTAPSQNCVVW